MTSGRAWVVAAAAVLTVCSLRVAGQQPGRGRATPPQPQQKQGPEYLVGQWAITWTGRESPLTAGPRSGTVTFTRKGETTLDINTQGKVEDSGAAFTERGSAEWNEAARTLTLTEKLSNGTELSGIGDWSSPLSIRYQSKPVRTSGQTIVVRRVYAIISAQSFSVTEEMSVDGGPFQRLGNGLFTKTDK